MLDTLDPDYGNGSEETTPLLSDNTNCSSSTSSGIKASSIAILKQEMQVIRRSALPILGSLLLEHNFTVVQIVSVGHLSTLALAAASLGSMTANVTGMSIFRGLTSALDTMLPSAHTSNRPELVALWCQRMAVVLSVSMFPILFIWMNGETILLHLNQDREIARLTGLYLRWFTIGLPGMGFKELCKCYFQSQGHFSVPTRILVIAVSVNVLLNYLLVWGPEPFRLGFIGAPIGAAISYTLIPIISVIYGVFLLPHAAWHPLSSELFTNLGILARLGLYGVGQVASEWWAWEILAIAASFLGHVSMASQSILATIASATWQVGFAVACAAGIRIGHHLGATDPYRALAAANASLLLGLISSFVLASSLMFFRQSMACLLSSDPEVTRKVASTIPIIALFQLVDANAGVTSGILRATGRQYISALLNISAFYFLGLPCSIYLAFGWHLHLHGLWIGFIVALLYCSVIGTVLCLKTDWAQEVMKVQSRLHEARASKNVDEEVTFG